MNTLSQLQDTKLRKAGIQDSESIAQIQIVSWKSAYLGIIPISYLNAMNLEHVTSIWQNGLAQQKVRVWLIESRMTALGFAAFGKSRDKDADPETGELYAIYLMPGVLGLGLGRRVWLKALEDLKADSYTDCVVWVLEQNRSAKRFYEKLGFVDDNTRQTVVFDNHAVEKMRYRMRSLDEQ